METFKKLDMAKKSEYLESIFLAFIKNDEKLYNNLDTFLLGANETELCEMYEVILNPASVQDYINHQRQKIKKGNQEMTDMMYLLKKNIICLKENNEKKDDLDDMLKNI